MSPPVKRPSLSVIVPAHNSGALLNDTVRRLAERLHDRDAEIVMVENGSMDDTWRRCESLLAESHCRGHSLIALRCDKGMGNALRTGILASSGQWVLLTADDLPFGFDDIDAADRLFGTARKVPPIIIGSKAHPDSMVRRRWTRQALTRGYGVLRRIVLGMRVGDSQGTILMEGGLARSLAASARESGFLFTTEMIFLAERAGVRSVEIPVSLARNHANHPSRVALSDLWTMATGLIRLRYRTFHAARAATHQAPRVSSARQQDLVRALLGVLMSSVFLWLTMRQVEGARVWANLSTLQLPMLAIVLMICLLEVAVRALRWRVVFLPAARISIAASYAYICVGHFANAMLPFRLGDVARAYLAGGKFGVSRMMVLGTILVERLADGFTLLAVVAASIIAGVAIDGSRASSLVLAAGVTLSLLILAATLRQHAVTFARLRLRRLSPLLRLRDAFSFLRSPRSAAQVGILTLTSFALSVVILQSALLATGVVLPWWQTAVAIGAMTLSTAIPAAPGAVGTYEFVGTAALASFGVESGSAFVAVVSVHLLATLPPALIGLVTTLALHVDVMGMRHGEMRSPTVESLARAEHAGA